MQHGIDVTLATVARLTFSVITGALPFLVRSLIWTAIVAPPEFLFVAVQHSAMTHPFWDYCELIPFFDKLQSGTLALSDLFAPQKPHPSRHVARTSARQCLAHGLGHPIRVCLPPGRAR